MNYYNSIFDQSIIEMLNDVFKSLPTYRQPQQTYKPNSSLYSTIAELPVKRVIYSNDKTIVYFKDGTKTIVTRSAADKYDKQTAIAYAILKRIFGKIGAFDANNKWDPYLVEGNGLGLKLEKLAEAGYDQEVEKKNIAAEKARAKADHLARQKAEADAAWQKRVERRAEEILLEREAQKLADANSLNKAHTCNKQMLTETVKNDDIQDVIYAKNPPMDMPRTSGLVQIDPKDAWKLYQKPNKPFREFTQEEKREYWRWQNAKRKASK